jgi:non-ribosomal peptide synthetase component E (peptide arylation enzyme)
LQTRAYDIIEAKMHEFPENIAVVFKDEHLSYSQLEKRVDQLANVLHSHGVGSSIFLQKLHADK